MKSKIETTTPQQQEIDWSKPVLVMNHMGDVVLTSGEVDENLFYGTVIVNKAYSLGASVLFNKSVFTALPLPQTITFYK